MPPEPVQEKATENVKHAVEQAKQEVTSSREPWYRSFKRAQILIGIYILEVVLFTLLAVFVFIHPILPIDIAITQEFQENQSPWLRILMLAVSYLGSNWPVFAALTLLTALALWVVQLRLEAVLIISLSVVSTLLNNLIKIIVSRPRPTAQFVEIIQAASGKSFPSGHVMSYVAYFGLLFSLTLILFKRDHWWQYVILIVSGLFVVLVGPSRIYLGDHWASDVLGGYLLGSLLLGISLSIYLRLKNKGVLAPKAEPGKRIVDPKPLPGHAE
ncbi:MAG: phosphatase PAP2 family protein [Chloroflexi bacterium]|nr:phosphatase PAP2 family protein [Chloroflexota bacterium]